MHNIVKIHSLFELLAYLTGFLLTKFVFNSKPLFPQKQTLFYSYYTVAILGVVLGALLFGTLNTQLSVGAKNIIGKSILGALVGGIVAVELFKKTFRIRGSTGARFVPSLTIGIAIGRVGCFLSGVADYTYGVPTTVSWGYDFGDGILRHPVQLYESLAMLVFFVYTILLWKYNQNYFDKNVFYHFIIFYSLQRIIWEIFKPYKKLFFNLNLFQLTCIVLIGYGLYHLSNLDRSRQSNSSNRGSQCA